MTMSLKHSELRGGSNRPLLIVEGGGWREGYIIVPVLTFGRPRCFAFFGNIYIHFLSKATGDEYSTK